MKKLALFSDTLFAFLVGGIFSLVLFRSLQIDLLPSLLLALLCGALIALAVAAWLLYRRKNLYLKRSDEAEKQKLLLHLALLSDEAKTTLFQRAVSKATSAPCGRFGRLRVFTKTEFYFLKFSISPVEPDEIATLSRLKTGKKKVLFCSEINADALGLCKRLSIEVRTGNEVYLFLKKNGCLPDEYLGEAKPTDKSKRRLKLWFSKTNSRRFLTGGALILLFSRFTPYYVYYLLVGVLLLFSAVFVRIFGYE